MMGGKLADKEKQQILNTSSYRVTNDMLSETEESILYFFTYWFDIFLKEVIYCSFGFEIFVIFN